MLLTFRLVFLLFHLIKYYNHSLFSLLSHTLRHNFPLSFSHRLSLSLHHAAESEEEGDCEKDRKKGRVTKAEVTLIYSLLSTLQLGVEGQNTGNTFRDTIYSLTPTQVCFLCFFYVNLL